VTRLIHSAVELHLDDLVRMNLEKVHASFASIPSRLIDLVVFLTPCSTDIGFGTRECPNAGALRRRFKRD